MIHASGRRLDPLQPAARHDLIPGHRSLFRMATEHIRVQDRFGDLLLLDRHDHRVGGHRGDLPEVPVLDRVTENDAHGIQSTKCLLRSQGRQTLGMPPEYPISGEIGYKHPISGEIGYKHPTKCLPRSQGRQTLGMSPSHPISREIGRKKSSIASHLPGVGRVKNPVPVRLACSRT
jgi:hypothetical protein